MLRSGNGLITTLDGKGLKISCLSVILPLRKVGNPSKCNPNLNSPDGALGLVRPPGCIRLIYVVKQANLWL